MTDSVELRYFADPMCSWCWGFAPLLARLLEDPKTPPLRVIVGGLRAGETRPITPELRETVLSHWHHVHAASGQAFAFDGALPDGFVYDTEPACRAVVAAGNAQRASMLHAVQQAFYADGRDVTDTATLADIAAGIGLDRDAFLGRFTAADTAEQTRADFERGRDHGVSGFPTLLLARPQRLRIVSIGYCPWDTLSERLETALSRDA